MTSYAFVNRILSERSDGSFQYRDADIPKKLSGASSNITYLLNCLDGVDYYFVDLLVINPVSIKLLEIVNETKNIRTLIEKLKSLSDKLTSEEILNGIEKFHPNITDNENPKYEYNVVDPGTGKACGKYVGKKSTGNTIEWTE